MNDLHEIERTNKIITIIGLVFEGVAALSYLVMILVWDKVLGYYELLEADMSPSEFKFTMEIMDFVGDIIMVVGVITIIVVLVNLFLFTKLVRGRFDETTARKVYLYQAIWGGINLLSNQITGILYLVSGVRGFNGQREETDIRDGI